MGSPSTSDSMSRVTDLVRESGQFLGVLLEELRVVVAHGAQRLAGVGARDHGVVVAPADERFAVARHHMGLGRGDEAGTHPHPVGPEGQGGSESPAVEDPAGGHDRHPAADGVDDLGHEGQGGDGAGVPTALGALGNHDVAAGLDRGLGVAHLPAHVGDEDARRMALVDHLAGDAEPGDEERCPTGDDGVDLVRHAAGQGGEQVDPEGGAGALADLRDLGLHLLEAERRGTESAEAAGGTHGGDEIGIGHPAHPGEHHGVLTVEQVGQSGADHGVLRRRAVGLLGFRGWSGRVRPTPARSRRSGARWSTALGCRRRPSRAPTGWQRADGDLRRAR